MENYGSERVFPGTSTSSLYYHNSPLALDQRDILIDFTLKDTPPTVQPCKTDNTDADMVSTHHVIRSEDQEEPFTAKDMRHSLLHDGSYGKVEKQNDSRMELASVNFHRTINQLKARDDSAQIVTVHKGDEEIMLEANHVKDIVTALMLRKDMRARMSLRDAEEFPVFDSGKKLALPVNMVEDDSNISFHSDQKHMFQDERKDKELSLLISSKNLSEYFQMKNNPPSSIAEQNVADKIPFSYFVKGQDQLIEKHELSPFAALQKHSRIKNQLTTFSTLEDDIELKRSLPLVSIAEQSRIIRSAPSPASFNQGEFRETKLSAGFNSEDVRLECTPSSYFSGERRVQMKNIVSLAGDQGQHIRINESCSPLAHVQKADLTHLSASSSSALSPEQIQVSGTPSNFVYSQINSAMKNITSSSSKAVDHGQIKNYDLEKGNAILFAQDKLLNLGASSFSFLQDQMRVKNESPPYNTQQPLELKKSPFHSHSDSCVQLQAKLPSAPVATSLGQSYLSKNQSFPPSFSVVQIEFPVKNVHSMLESSERYLADEILYTKKAPLPSSLSKAVIQDSTIFKGASLSMDRVKLQKRYQTKNSVLCHSVSKLKDTVQVPLHAVVSDDIRQKNCSTQFRNSLNEHAEIRGDDATLKNQRNSFLEAQHNGESVPDHILQGDIIDGRTFRPIHKSSADQQSSSRNILDMPLEFNLVRTKEIHNQHSVIAQVGLRCKACSFCQSFFYENGFLPVEDSCPLCLHHAKEGMKCVCHHPAIKDDKCTCVEKKYRCAFCNETFPTILQLQKHTFSHITSENMDDSHVGSAKDTEIKVSHVCSVCDMSFPSSTALDLHEQSHKDNYCKKCNSTFQCLNEARHSCEARFTCNLCGAGFASNYNLKMHVLKHFGNLPYKCGECSKSFAKPSELSKHSLAHCGERPYLCDECNMSFTSSTSLRNHKNTHSGRKPHLCHICNKSFTRRADVRRHMLIHTGARPHACSVCGLAFADASNMRKHLQTHSKPQHGPDIKTYHCTYCGKMFARPSELKRHFFTHTNTRPYSCHICGLAFTDSSNLKKHIQTHERATEHTCPQCDLSFQSFNELENHVSSSHGSKRFDPSTGHTCQTCGAAFNQLVDLQDHVLSHGASPTFKCEICSKTFCEQLFLERHLLTHTESRPFTCSECLKSFKSLSHLRSHILTHTGEKTHVCLTCNKSFLKKSSLLRHQSIHAREKVISFKTCFANRNFIL